LWPASPELLGEIRLRVISPSVIDASMPLTATTNMKQPAHLYRKNILIVWIQGDNFRLARDARHQCKLHLDVRAVSVDVLVVIKSVQFEPNVDVSTSMCSSV